MNAEILRHEVSRTQRDSPPALSFMSNNSASPSQGHHRLFCERFIVTTCHRVVALTCLVNRPIEGSSNPGPAADCQARACCPLPFSRGSTRTGGMPRGVAWRYGSAGRWLRATASTCRLSFGVPAVPASVSSWVMRPLDGVLLGQTQGLASHIDRMKSETPGLTAPGLMREIDSSI